MALQRIEAALARLEAAANRRPPEDAGGDPGSSADYERLAVRHQSLRRKVQGAIGQIDRLLAATERG